MAQSVKHLTLFLFFKFIYFERERKGGAERERENPKEAARGQLGAQCGARSHKL